MAEGIPLVQDWSLLICRLEVGLMSAGFWWEQESTVNLRGGGDMPQCSGKPQTVENCSRETAMQHQQLAS